MPGIIERYHRFLPIEPKFIVTLQEGNTPLLPAPRLARSIFGEGGAQRTAPLLYLKLEGLNPTGSFKDRGMTYAVSKALEEGSDSLICASTGNTSASAAAYGARAGMKVSILIPKGKIAKGKLAQAMIYGANIVAIRGNFDQALLIVREIQKMKLATVVNSVNPYRLEGQKTAAFEICEQLGTVPTYHALPVGNAGNITATWRGYREWLAGRSDLTLPKMLGFEAAGAAPIVLGRIVKSPETVASAIRIGNPASWKGALAARDESGGLIDKVSDREILEAYRSIARWEGYFCEPASAASVAGIKKYAKKNLFKAGDVIVCTLTGHGLKDPDTAICVSKPPLVVSPEIEKIRKVLKL